MYQSTNNSTALPSYYELIERNINENIMKDPTYVCMECGRLKNEDMELSGTVCNTCSTTNLTLDPNINKFTTIVKNFQLGIRIPGIRMQHNATSVQNDENLFIKPSDKITEELGSVENCTQYPYNIKKVLNVKQMNKIIDKSLQTDLSFHPLDDVSFLINKRLTKSNETANSELTYSQCEKNQAPNIAISDEFSNETANSELTYSQCEKNHVPNIAISDEFINETDTEVIEPSVDDWLMPRKIVTSPLLFSPETKEDDSDHEDCVGATPTKDIATISTCNWRKENQVVPVEELNKMLESKICSREAECVNNLNNNENNDEEMVENEVECEANNEQSNSCVAKEDEGNNDAKEEKFSTSFVETAKVNILEHEELLLSQSTDKISKHNLKIVISSLEEGDCKKMEMFIEFFNPVVDSDVNQQTDFLVVGVDRDNKVLKRTPKFLKAISLHTCVVNSEYIYQCCLKKDIVSLEKKFIPLDSSGIPGPVQSYIRQNHNLFGGFIFFSLERDSYLSSLIEFLVIQNGGKIITKIKLFNAYNTDPPVETSVDSSFSGLGVRDPVQYKKILLYGDNEEEQMNAVYKGKLFSVFKCQCFNYNSLFNAVACYDVEEFGLEMEPF